MPLFPKPHSPEWFGALASFNPQQAAHTETIVKAAGSPEVCSVCGDNPAQDYKLTNDLPPEAVATIRLCDDCLGMRGAAGEKLIAF